MAHQELDDFIDTYRQALQTVVAGDAAPVLAFFSARDDVTSPILSGRRAGGGPPWMKRVGSRRRTSASVR